MFAPPAQQSQSNNLAIKSNDNNDNKGFCLDANQNVMRPKCDFCDNDAKFACARYYLILRFFSLCVISNRKAFLYS